ncbi:MAG TPA: hypothetical protein VI854_09190 [Acidimicrobiia bacterium]|nr:hypothetical protein [Acidimicrobiia bacterium]
MTWWWIGNIVLIGVVIPVVIFYANKVLRPVREIRLYADDILEHGVALTGTLDAIPKLVETRELTGTARRVVNEYGTAVGGLL